MWEWGCHALLCCATRCPVGCDTRNAPTRACALNPLVCLCSAAGTARSPGLGGEFQASPQGCVAGCVPWATGLCQSCSHRAGRGLQAKPGLAQGPKVSLLSLVASPQPGAQVDQLHHESRAELDPGVRLSWAGPAVQQQLRNSLWSCFGKCCECMGRTGRALCCGSTSPRCFLHD